MFSQRSDWSADPNPLSQAIEARRSGGRPLLDLTVSNPTQLGLTADLEPLRAALKTPEAARYEPNPVGLPKAREAVRDYYARRGVSVDPEQIVLTATTSEAYSFIFRLLIEPDGAIAAPCPSYPLFSFLCELADARMVPYALRYRDRWRIAEPLPEARALITVSPNNPTGSVLSASERALLRGWALQQKDRALICDEVFLDYAPRFSQGTWAEEPDALCFSLSGLSKVAAAPQLKLSWIVVSGPEPLRREALTRLEIIADTFLSVAGPVQHALPELLANADIVQDKVRARLSENLAQVRAHLGAQTRTYEGGWYVVVDLPEGLDDGAWAIRLVEQGVLVHPGYLFDIEDAQVIVLSLLPEPEVMKAGLRALQNELGS